MIEKQLLDLVNYRIERSYTTLKEAGKLIEQDMLFIAMNRVYYAGFYIVNALSLLDNFSTSKHTQLIGYFNKNYLHTGIIDANIGDILNISYRKRTSVDYQDFASITLEELIKYYEAMKIFVEKVNILIKEKIKKS